jgi:protein-tyrosine phosphatase
MNGGADEIPLPEGPGRLWLCGKHFIGPDPELVLSRLGADRVVCLCERHEIEDRYPKYADWLEVHDLGRARWRPVHDLHAPELAAALSLVDELRSMITAGHGIVMHCGAGIGRAGTMAAALLIRMGLDEPAARRVVAQARPLAGPEAGPQADLLLAIRPG